MSGGVETIVSADEPAQVAPDRDWAAHRSALRTPELRSVLEQLHARLETFIKDPERT